MANISNTPQRVVNDQQSLSNGHFFSEYMLQDQMRDDVFIASLTAFRSELHRIKKVARLRRAGLDWYLMKLSELKQQFDIYIHTLRQQKLLQFTLPMELALWATHVQWFSHYQVPQIYRGWQQAAEGFRSMADPSDS